jgi:hypothetical protein
MPKLARDLARFWTTAQWTQCPELLAPRSITSTDSLRLLPVVYCLLLRPGKMLLTGETRKARETITGRVAGPGVPPAQSMSCRLKASTVSRTTSQSQGACHVGQTTCPSGYPSLAECRPNQQINLARPEASRGAPSWPWARISLFLGRVFPNPPVAG